MAIDSRWNRKKLEKQLAEWSGNPVVRETVHDRAVAKLLAYANLEERKFSNEHTTRAAGYQPQPNSAALGSVGLAHRCSAISHLSQGDEAGWDVLPLAVAYEAWRDRLQVRIFERLRTESTAISRLNAALTLTAAIAVGDKAFSENQAGFLLKALRMGALGKSESRLLEWMLPLACGALQGLGQMDPAPVTLPGEYADILKFWDTPDLLVLADMVKAAADRHTAQARSSSNNTTFDFDDLAYAIYPVEILALLRLRQWRGLSNPGIDHPLMDGLPGRLAPPRDIRADGLLEKVIAKADRIYPERE